MKKLISAALCCVMLAGLGACGGNSADKQTAQGGSGGTVELKLDSGLTPTHIINDCGQAVADKIMEKTDDQVKVTFYPADTLGNSTERASMLIAGETDLSLQALSAFDKYNPRQGVLSAFFMFNSWDHYVKFSESDLYSEIMSGLESEINATVLGEVYYARRHMLSKKPIAALEDLKGMKFRAPNEPMPIASLEALGASPTPMAGNEVYMALQNGTIDATENGAEQIVSQAFYEVAPYMALTSHQYQTQVLLLSDAGRAKLSDEQYRALCEAVDETIAEYNVLSQEKEAEQEQFLKDNIAVIELDVTEMQKACEVMYDSFDDEWGDGTWEAIKAMA